MRRFTLILFVIALIIVAYETFKPQAPFPTPSPTSFAAQTVQGG
jgi:hypothetical protein